jgi:hypothetical protein
MTAPDTGIEIELTLLEPAAVALGGRALRGW